MPEDSTTPPQKRSNQPNHSFQIKGSKPSRHGNVLSVIPVLDESFLMMCENILAASFIFSDSVLVFVTSLFESMTGYSKEQLLAMNFLDFVHPDSVALVKSKWFVRSDKPLAPERFEVKLIDRSGQTKWLECSATSVVFKGRMSIWCTGYDITSRKRTEIALKASEENLRIFSHKSNERYKWIAELSTDLVLILNMDGRILYVSPLSRDLIGYLPDELTGKRIFRYICRRDLVLLRRRYPSVSHLPNRYKTNCRIICKNSQLRWFEAAVRISCGHENDTMGEIVVTLRDLSEYRKKEEDFLKASKMESLVVLAGGIAHDFNNFLTAMISNITLSKQGLDPESETFAFLSDAEKAAYEAKELTAQLMTFANSNRSEKKMVNLSDLIKRAAQFMLTGSNVDCEFILPADLWSVEVDVGQFNQVIDNLVINAMQAMPNGGVIVIKAENIHDKFNRDAKFVKIMIQDQGVGIPKKNLTKIFDPYFTTKKSGTGFGLATCYSIMKRHDGELAVSSVVGKGTVVTIILPVSKDLKPVFLEKEVGKKKDSTENVRPKKILLMDDEEKVLSGTGKMLKRIGYDVHVALEGEEAVRLYEQALARKEPFDIVVMDLTVSGGLGATETIRKLKSIDANVKSILSSGYFNDPAMKNYQELGFDGQIAKPYRVKELSRLINQII